MYESKEDTLVKDKGLAWTRNPSSVGHMTEPVIGKQEGDWASVAVASKRMRRSILKFGFDFDSIRLF
jgi:hypothetical protein